MPLGVEAAMVKDDDEFPSQCKRRESEGFISSTSGECGLCNDFLELVMQGRETSV